jgi:hypothetical protein
VKAVSIRGHAFVHGSADATRQHLLY